MRLWQACALLAISPLAGCASDFQVMGLAGGGAVQQVSSNLFRISASSGPLEDYADVQDRLLLKAAETTLQHGGTHFLVRATPARYADGDIVTGAISSATTVPKAERYGRVAPIQSLAGAQDAYIEVLYIPPGKDPPAAAISAQEITTFVGRRGSQA